MNFFNAVANWADSAHVDVSFARDEYDGWFARVSARDARGPYSIIVNEIPVPKKKNTDETEDTYSDKVRAAMVSAMVKAAKSRIGTTKPPSQVDASIAA